MGGWGGGGKRKCVLVLEKSSKVVVGGCSNGIETRARQFVSCATSKWQSMQCMMMMKVTMMMMLTVMSVAEAT